MRLETLAVRAGAEVDPETGAVAPPIHLSTTFEHGPACEEIHGYSYIREKNPTQTRLEEAMAKPRRRDRAGRSLPAWERHTRGACATQPDSRIILTCDPGSQ